MGTDQGVPGGDTNERNFSGVGISVGGFGIKISERFQFMLLTHLVMIFYCLPVIPLSPSVLYGRIH